MGTSFESAAIESIDLDRTHERAVQVLEASRINMRDFIEPYGEETIERDLQFVERKKKSFEKDSQSSKEMKEIADIFEAVVLEHGELSNWFGENAMTLKTSEYDDYENGVDAVIEFRHDEPGAASFLGLAADVTFSSDTTKKFDRLKSQIDKGELARVKYFHSEFMNIHGQLSKLPEVIIGADKRTVTEIAELWAERENTKLSQHRIQIMILTQMREQLKTFGIYARSIGQDEAAKLYEERLIVIEGILEEKSNLAKQTFYELDNDTVHASMMSFLKRWQSSISKA